MQTKTNNSIWFLALLLLAIGAAVLIWWTNSQGGPEVLQDLVVDAGTTQQQGIRIGTLEPVELLPNDLRNNFGRLASMSAVNQTDHTPWNVLDPGGFGFPEPPKEGCDQVSKETGAPCSKKGIEIFQNPQSPGGAVITDIILKSGGRIVVTARLYRFASGALGEQYNALFATGGRLEGIKNVWAATMETTAGFQGQQFGRWMWQISNIVARQLHGGPAIRVFSDTVGWGPKLYNSVPQELWFRYQEYIIQLLP